MKIVSQIKIQYYFLIIIIETQLKNTEALARIR